MISVNGYSQVRQKIIIELFLALFICLSPFIILVHLSFDELNRTISFLGLNITHFYPDNQSFVWHILNQSIPTLLLIILFYTTENLWRVYLAPLIILYILSIIHAIFPFIDFVELLLYKESIILVLILLEVLFQYHFKSLNNTDDLTINISRNEIISELLTKSQWKMNEEIEEIISSKNHLSQFHYTCKLYHLLITLEDYSTKFKSGKRTENLNSQLNKSVLRTIIPVLTLVFLFAGLLPSINTIKFLGIEIGNFGFPNATVFLWYLAQKVVILGVLGIWYLSINTWWKWAIFTPIIFYLYQLFDIFFGGVEIEETQNLITSPIVLFTITTIFFIAALIQKRNKQQKYYILIQEELQKGIYDLSEFKKA